MPKIIDGLFPNWINMQEIVNVIYPDEHVGKMTQEQMFALPYYWHDVTEFGKDVKTFVLVNLRDKF